MSANQQAYVYESRTTNATRSTKIQVGEGEGVESNTLMEIERWSAMRARAVRQARGSMQPQAASWPPPSMRSAPARMDVFHTVQHPLLLGGPQDGCEHKARPGSCRPLTRSRRPQPPAGPAFLAARAVGGAPPALPWVDAAAPGHRGRPRSSAPVNGRRARHRVDLSEEQRAGSGAAPRHGGRRLLVSSGRRRWDGFGREVLGG